MKIPLLSTLLFGTVLALAGCSGGTGGTGATSSSTNAVSIGVMTKGSIIVNGVHFDDSTATIRIDDRAGTSAELQSGMVVKVRGQINDDRLNGVAQQVEVENEVRGTVQTTNPSAVPPSFTVINQTALVDDLTVFANFTPTPASPSAAVTALTSGASIVEVHGLRDATGNIHASRVELLSANPLGDELRGIITGFSASTFTLNGVNVDFSGATVSPMGAILANGQPVEVHGSFSGATFFATRVDREDLEDVQFEHAAGEEFEIEGQVNGCGAANPCMSFSVGTQAVQTNASTRFENGTAADLADNIRIEAEGHQFTGTTLIAEKIEFKRARVIVTGMATVTGGTIPGAGTLEVLGKTVQITSFTEINQTNGVTTGELVEVRGFVDTTGTIVAERVDDNPSGGNRDILQARVTAKNGNVLTLLGINADLTGATQFSDTNKLPITQAAFLAAVTPAPAPGGTLVKVKGIFSSGTNTIAVDEAELEN